ncbi:O-6-methylguanine DNA methyltransferase [Thermoplasmatales archaeon BRNA1]|nr:O-6-methylguanine DNA methyltransferase [Thermoplasmatales archaeon BRNA1]
MGEEHIGTFMTAIGMVSIVTDGNTVRAVYLPSQNLPAMEEGTDPVMEQAVREIDEYLAGRRKVFDVPISIDGSDFAVDVLVSMSEIPYGETVTYSQLAEKSGHPGAARAVGTVCANNVLPILIPCHRVLASTGIGQYSGGVALKQRLLNIEKEYR